MSTLTMADFGELKPVTLGEYIGTVLAAALIAAGLTLLAGLWLGYRRGARRAWAEAQDKLADSEDERGQLVADLERLKVRLVWVSERRTRHHDRLQAVRRLTTDDHENDLPADTPLTVGQLVAVLDGDAQLTDKEGHRA